MRLFRKLFFIIPLLLVFSCSDDKKEEKDFLKIASSFDYPPFSFIEDKEFRGFEVDLIKEIAKRLNKEPKFEDLSFDSLIASLETKHSDLAIAAISKTPERSLKVDFSKPYYNSPSILILSIDNTATSLDDLDINQIFVLFGSSQEKLVNEKLLEKLKKPVVTSLNKVNEVVQAFVSDKTSVMIVDEVVAKNILDHHKNLEVKSFTIDESGYDFAIALPKGSELTPKINDILDAMQQDGTMKELKDKYNLS